MSKIFKMRAKVWIYPGPSESGGRWHFATLPKRQSDKIKADFAKVKRGWGSLPVSVTLGKTNWRTSIFPDKRAGAYLLPLKSEVRKKEKIYENQTITFTLEIEA